MDFSKIKLIIWDLDETFWNGTLSESEVDLPENNKNLILTLTDMGIVNSICSKNNPEQVDKKLKEFGLSEYFVFKSVDWSAKGNRVKNIVSDMQLRFPNVLFIDDNSSNLEEVKYFCPEIMTSTPEVIFELCKWSDNQPKKDKEHKRLKQYKILEEKSQKKLNFNSNEEFLMSSHIKLKIQNDCSENVDRIADLVMRSNQLNFTKKRDNAEKLNLLFKDSHYNCGYVSVSDDYGDYGIVGFFAIKDNKCEHFLFSCRTLGMGIEQYTYNYLNRPQLEIVGEVVSDLSSTELPKWINQNTDSDAKSGNVIVNSNEHSVLIKGPCDLFQIFPFIGKSECIDTEFTYVLPNGATVESTSHTTHIIEAKRLTKEQKETVVNELPFMDMGAYNDNIYKLPYKVVVLSLLQDFNLGVYKRKATGEKFAFLEYTSDMTNPDNYDKLINKKCNVGGFDFTIEFLKEFEKKYEFLGRNTPEIILENLKEIRKNINDDTVLVLMLGTEVYYDMAGNPAYTDRHLVHKELNDKVREWAKTQDNVELVDVNKYVKSKDDFYDHINHFIKPVYYNLAKDIVEIVNKNSKVKVKETSKLKVYYMKFHDAVGNFLHKIKRG